MRLAQFLARLLNWRVLRQSRALATLEIPRAITPMRVCEADAPAPAEAPAHIQFRPRLTYAQTQAQWEWEHNKRAQEIYRRQKEGFF